MAKSEALLTRFNALNEQAIELLTISKNKLTEAFVALDTIRSERLYVEGGFRSFEEYLTWFSENYGISRSLLYENLSVVKKAYLAGFSYVELIEYGLVTLKPWFAPALVQVQKDRLEIKSPELKQKIQGSLKDFIVENTDPQTPARLVRETIEGLGGKTKIVYTPIFYDDHYGLKWTHGADEGFILFRRDSTLPETLEEIARKLNR